MYNTFLYTPKQYTEIFFILLQLNKTTLCDFFKPKYISKGIGNIKTPSVKGLTQVYHFAFLPEYLCNIFQSEELLSQKLRI